MTLREIEDQVKSYVRDSFLDADIPLDMDDDLLKVLDSLQVLRMVISLEASFNIKVQENELTAEHLGSVRKVAAFVDAKRKADQPAVARETDRALT